jgi:O-antigen ligase
MSANVFTRPGATRGQPSRRGASLILFPVSCSVVLFAAVYPWVYRPLLAGIVLLGAYGWITASRSDREPARPLTVSLLALMTIMSMQLIPLPADVLLRISPATDAFLREYDFGYSLALTAGVPLTHPLSIAPDATLRGLGFLASLSVFLVGCTALLPRVRLGSAVRGLIALGFLIAIFGIVQHATFNDRLYWFWAPVNVASNAFGPFVNRNHFAGWMVMAICLTTGYLCAVLAQEGAKGPHSWSRRAEWLSSRHASRVLFVSVALIVMALSVVWTLSRSGIGALAVALGLFAWRAAVRLPQSRRAFAASLAVSVLLGAIAWRGLDTVVDWYGRTGTLEWRMRLWVDTVPIIRSFWWTGTGLNTYGIATLLYPTRDDAWHPAEAHNDYVQLASEGGVLLVIAVAWATFLLITGIRRALKAPQSRERYWVRTGAAIGLLAIAVQELADFSLQIPANAVLFALLAAIGLHRSPDSAGPAQHLGLPGKAVSP